MQTKTGSVKEEGKRTVGVLLAANQLRESANKLDFTLPESSDQNGGKLVLKSAGASRSLMKVGHLMVPRPQQIIKRSKNQINIRNSRHAGSCN
jgi:hypothetical protein